MRKATLASRKQHREVAFHEVKHTPPAILKKTEQKSGKSQAKKQAVAIALNKSRRG